MIRVMLVDDHALVRVGFRMLLADAQMDVVAETDSGEEALPLYRQLKPDVVVMDLSMPGMGGLEAVRRLLLQDPRARILMLSAHEDTAHPQRAVEAGALGYLTKRSAPEVLIAAVTAVAAGDTYIDAQTVQAMGHAKAAGLGNPSTILTSREFDVFLQLARGASVNEIAEDMHLSASTVGTHLFRIKQKLGARNQAELTLTAIAWELLLS